MRLTRLLKPISHARDLLLWYTSKKVTSKLHKLTNYKSNYTSSMYMKVNTSLCKKGMQTNEKTRMTRWFYPEVHVLANTLVRVVSIAHLVVRWLIGTTLEALDVSMDFLLFSILAHHLGILIKHWMPCSSTPSCLLLLLHQVTTIFMVDLDLFLGCLFLLNLWLWLRLFLLLHQLLGWAQRGEMTPCAALEAFDML